MYGLEEEETVERPRCGGIEGDAVQCHLEKEEVGHEAAQQIDQELSVDLVSSHNHHLRQREQEARLLSGNNRRASDWG